MEILGNCIGLIELNSIAAGYEVTDAMLKAAEVHLVISRTVCAGKYIVLVRGDVAAVTASVAAGEDWGRGAVIDSFVIPNIHEQVCPAFTGTGPHSHLDALGVLEAFTVAALIEGADAAVKAAAVDLLEIRLAVALGGKAFVTLTGSVSAVQSAIEAGARVISEKGMLVNKVVIPNPRQELMEEYI